MRREISSLVLLALWLLFLASGPLHAQGIQTGTIRGVVTDQQNLPAPGTVVTATSPSLQAPRSTVTDRQGIYAIPGLPPGTYEVRYELPAFETVTQTVSVPLGLPVVIDVTLRPGGLTETVQVASALPAPLSTAVVGQNIRSEEIESLATPRTIQGIAQLAPAVNEQSPNAGQLIVNGAFAYDNVFMVNGVDVNDNLFATPQNLFIEDAIEETQVLTSGISAEYGRFTGGVINAITKSGGNEFSGSGRINFFNDSWTTETPFEECADTGLVVCSRATEHLDKLNRTYEGTFGGPVLRDRLWFFLAGRHQKSSGQTTLQQTGIVVPTSDENKRWEVKLTGTVANNHTLQGGFLDDPRKRQNNSGIQSLLIDPRSEVDRENPNWYSYGNYRGVLGANTLVEVQASERRFEFKGDGGTSLDIVDSPFVGVCYCNVFNAPYFDATDPEARNNRQITGNVTNFWEGAGRHETKAGYEFFRSTRTGGNSQSSTSYVFAADFLAANGSPAVDPQGRLIPVFVPEVTTLYYYPAVRGATMNIDNQSFFVQDHWVLNDRITADLGFRYEHVKAVSTGDIVSIDTGRIVPRLAMAWDLAGTGERIVNVTYGQYSGRYNEALIGANSPVGNPAEVSATYLGPAGQGLDFAPGFDLANYPINADNASAADPLQNVFMDDGVQSPLLHEFTTSFGESFMDGRGHAEASYIFRRTTSLIDDFSTLETGTTDVVVQGINAGTFTNTVYRNVDSDVAWRRFQSIVLQSRFRVSNNLTVNGHYTVQLENDGTYEGEETNQPGDVSAIGDYPEAFPANRYYPAGRLQSFQRNRFRAWAVWVQPLGRAGDISVSGLFRLEGERAFSYGIRNVSTNATQAAILAAAGYTDAPTQTHLYFGDERGTGRFPGYGLFDLSFNYNIPVFRTLRPWIKFDIYNALDNRKLIAWNTTVSQDPNSPLDAVGLRTGFVEGSSFGRATGNTVTNMGANGTIDAFPRAFSGAPAGGRTFRMAVGFRF